MESPPPHNDERRAQARIKAALAIRLDVELVVGRNERYRVVVRDTSSTGTRLVFPTKTPPELTLGALVEVRFRERAVGKPIVARGQVMNIDEIDGLGSVGIHFSRRDAFYRQLTPKLWEQFNRRRTPRKRAADEHAFEVRISAGIHTWTAAAHDVSTDGISLALDDEQAADIVDYEIFQVAATLPDNCGEFDLAAVAKHRTPFGPAVRVGMIFDTNRSRDLQVQVQRLEEYLRGETAEL